ncbi:DgyrCDS2781 [Dimorphilus gyrociliatus]|uniref:DgyrCDS2781 n=1 Tax=Dimorphilus gyrociliatus TaxID=2664684 RepID=A0A7I8VEC2_9ANNE|nr:DgyrCDS2781 [Dimorphilus gyrociliatus]
MVFFVLVLSVKVYFIGIVWSCYKYLHARNRSRIYDIRELDSADSTHSAEAQANIVMPPKYEDAVRMTTDDQPTPPPYVP